MHIAVRLGVCCIPFRSWGAAAGTFWPAASARPRFFKHPYVHESLEDKWQVISGSGIMTFKHPYVHGSLEDKWQVISASVITTFKHPCTWISQRQMAGNRWHCDHYFQACICIHGPLKEKWQIISGSVIMTFKHPCTWISQRQNGKELFTATPHSSQV